MKYNPYQRADVEKARNTSLAVNLVHYSIIYHIPVVKTMQMTPQIMNNKLEANS